MRQNGKLVNSLEREDKIARKLSVVDDRNKKEHNLIRRSSIEVFGGRCLIPQRSCL